MKLATKLKRTLRFCAALAVGILATTGVWAEAVADESGQIPKLSVSFNAKDLTSSGSVTVTGQSANNADAYGYGFNGYALDSSVSGATALYNHRTANSGNLFGISNAETVSPFAISLFAKVGTTPDRMLFYMRYYTEGAGFLVCTSADGTKLVGYWMTGPKPWTFTRGNTLLDSSADSVDFSQWHHYVINADSSGVVKVYVDGVEKKSLTYLTDNNGNANREPAKKSYSAFHIGAHASSTKYTTASVVYDDVRIYAGANTTVDGTDYALTANEIASLYNAGFSAKKTVAYNDTQTTFDTTLSSVLGSASSGDTVTPILDRVTETTVTIPTGVTLAVDSGADLSALDITCNGSIKVNVASEPSTSDVLLTTKGNSTGLNVVSDDYYLEGTYDSENAKTTWSATSYAAEGSYIRVWGQDFENSSTVEENWTYAIGNETLEALLKVLKNSSSTQMNHTGYSPVRDQKLHLMANGDSSKYLQFYKTGRNGNGNGCWSARYTFPQIFNQTSSYRFEFDWYGVSGVGGDTGYLCLESSDGIITAFGIPASSTTATFYKMEDGALVQDGTITVDERGTSSESGSHWHHIVIRGDKANDETTIQVTSLSGTEELSTRTLSNFVPLSYIYAYSETDNPGFPADWGFDNFVLKAPQPLCAPSAPVISATTTSTSYARDILISAVEGDTITYWLASDSTPHTATSQATLTISSSDTVYAYAEKSGLISETTSTFFYAGISSEVMASPTSVYRKGFNTIYAYASQASIIGQPTPTMVAENSLETKEALEAATSGYVLMSDLDGGGNVTVKATNADYIDSNGLVFSPRSPSLSAYALKNVVDYTELYSVSKITRNTVFTDKSDDHTYNGIQYKSYRVSGNSISDFLYYYSSDSTRWRTMGADGIGTNNDNYDWSNTLIIPDLKVGDIVLVNCAIDKISKVENLYLADGETDLSATAQTETLTKDTTLSRDYEYFYCMTHDGAARIVFATGWRLYAVAVYTSASVQVNGRGYLTIAEAIAAAQAAGNSSVSVSLVASVTEDVTIPAGMTVTITEDTENIYTLTGTVTAADGTTVEASEGVYTYSCPKQWTDTNTLTADTTLDDGAYFANQTLYVPKNAEGYDVTMTITGEGSSLKMYAGVFVANKSGTGAIVIEEGGAFTVSGTNNLTLGNADDASGSVTVNAGTLDWSNNTIRLGTTSGATGTLTVNEGATVVATHYNVGEVTGATGNLIVTGGSLTAQRINMGGPASSGNNMSTSDHTGTTATYAQSGGTVTVSESFYICKYLNSIGSATLSGGTLTVPAVEAGYGTGTLLLNGGTLKASKNQNSFIPSANATTTIGANGAIIDTQSYTVTIPANLAAADGVESPSLTKKGLGTLTLSAQTAALVIKVEAGSVTVSQTSGCTAGAGTKREENGDNYVFTKGPVIEPNAASETETTAASQEAADAIAETYNVTLTSEQEEQGLKASYYKVAATPKKGEEGRYIISVILDEAVAPVVDTSKEPMTVAADKVTFAVYTTSLKTGLYYGLKLDDGNGKISREKKVLYDGSNADKVQDALTADLPGSGVLYYTIEASDTATVSE